MATKNQKHRLVVAAYSAVVLACCFVDLLPFDVLGDRYYEVKELLTIAVIGLALECVGFENLRVKGLLFTLYCWRWFIFAGNMFAVETWFCSAYLIVALTLLAFLCFRASKEEGVSAVEPVDTAAYALVRVHTYFGLFQKTFMFWHAPYETRVLVFKNHFWCVHRGRFKRFDRSAWKWFNDVRWVPIGRDLTREELNYVNSLIGQRSIYGIKDCRRLMVAGNPKQYMKGES